MGARNDTGSKVHISWSYIESIFAIKKTVHVYNDIMIVQIRFQTTGNAGPELACCVISRVAGSTNSLHTSKSKWYISIFIMYVVRRVL